MFGIFKRMKICESKIKELHGNDVTMCIFNKTIGSEIIRQRREIDQLKQDIAVLRAVWVDQLNNRVMK
jgi:hypothetical protein